jgi:hypothetical protein
VIPKNWTLDAALDILNLPELIDSNQVIEIIEKHCPFKKDVAYEEVGTVSKKLDEILSILRYLRSAR